jgi:uncharacterized membrane protein
MVTPPDWVIRITDEDAAMSCFPWSRGHLFSPRMEWDARSGNLFGAQIGASLFPLTAPHNSNHIERINAEIRYLTVPLRLYLRWYAMEGPVYDYALHYREWKMSRMDALIEPSSKHPRAGIHAGVISLREFETIARQIAEIIADGYSWEAVCDANGCPAAKHA